MRKVIVFNQVSLDGFFTDSAGDMSWAHKSDAEWNAFAADNAKNNAGGVLLFGRVTYEMMASFWPTAQAKAFAPDIAEGMNSLSKVVFSRTLDEVSWANTRLVKTDMLAEVRALKQGSGKHIAVMGSGTVVSQLAQAGLVDEYQMVVNPIALGGGRTLFEGVEHPLPLKLTKTRAFTNGNVVLYYEPA